MTDYSKWDKFDADEAEQEVDERHALEEKQRKQRAVYSSDAKEYETTLRNAQRRAEILEAKRAVEAAKQKGYGKRLRELERSKHNSELKSNLSQIADEASTQQSQHELPQDVNATSSPTQLLNALTEFLFRLMRKVDELRVCTEKLPRHREGYRLAMDAMKEISAFTELKNITESAIRCNASNLNSSKGERGDTIIDPVSAEIISDLNESENFLVDQVLVCSCLFAFSCHEYAQTVDLCRVVLKRQQDCADAGVWIMRGLAFAAMGSLSLCKLHFSSAKSVNPQYPGLSETYKLIEIAQQQHADITCAMSLLDLVEAELKRVIDNLHHDELLQRVPDLAVIHEEDLERILRIGGCSSAAAKDVDQIGSVSKNTLHVCVEYENEEEEEQQQQQDLKVSERKDAMASDIRLIDDENTLFKHLLTKINDDKSAAQFGGFAAYFSLCRRTFYEAQMLYLESFFYSAQVKYITCVVLCQLKGYFEKLNSNDKYLNHLEASCCVNIATCLIQRGIGCSAYRVMKELSDSDVTSMGSLIRNGTSVMWMRKALALSDALTVRYRYIHVLCKSEYYKEALDQCSKLRGIIEERSDDIARPYSSSGRDDLLQEDNYLLYSMNGRILGQQFTGGFRLPLDIRALEPINCAVNTTENCNKEDAVSMKSRWLLQLNNTESHVRFLCDKYGVNTIV